MLTTEIKNPNLLSMAIVQKLNGQPGKPTVEQINQTVNIISDLIYERPSTIFDILWRHGEDRMVDSLEEVAKQEHSVDENKSWDKLSL